LRGGERNGKKEVPSLWEGSRRIETDDVPELRKEILSRLSKYIYKEKILQRMCIISRNSRH